MIQKFGTPKSSSERIVRDIRRATRKQYSAEKKIRIVLDGLRGEHSIAELCRREGIAESLYYTWSKEFLEAGKRRLAGDTARAATSGEVKDLRPGSPSAEGGCRRTGAGIAPAQKKHDRGWGTRGMRFLASEKLEIIRLVEQSNLPVRRTLEKLGVSRAFYRWCDPDLPGPTASGTEFLTMCGARSCNWP
jgi:putative transposase